jgi:hypothetical protein
LLLATASRPGAAKPPSITAGGFGAAVTVSLERQAYCRQMAVHEEARRLHVQPLADVFANLDLVSAALAALARRRVASVSDARHSQRQGQRPLCGCVVPERIFEVG